MKTSMFHIYSIGNLLNDVERNNPYVEVVPVEAISSVQGDVSEVKENNITIKDRSGNTTNIVNSKKTSIRARWWNIGSPNRINPPELGKGSMVILFRVGNTNQYYWVPLGNEIDLKKEESMVIALSNKKTIKDKSLLKKMYYFVMDTINKKVRFHTDGSNGELTTYDVEIDTKTGILTFEDGKGNTYKLESKDGNMTSSINGTNDQTINIDRKIKIVGIDTLEVGKDQTITLKANRVTNITGNDTETIGGNKEITLKKLKIINDTAELIATLSDIIQAIIDGKTIGNLGVDTVVHPDTIAALSALKEKMDSFKL